MSDDQVACRLDAAHPGAEPGFSDRDKAAIGARLGAYPGWSVAYAIEDGVEYARMSAGSRAAGSPMLTLARRNGLTGFAALWSDGSQMGAALSASLSGALAFIVQAIEDAWSGAGGETGDKLVRDCA